MRGTRHAGLARSAKTADAASVRAPSTTYFFCALAPPTIKKPPPRTVFLPKCGLHFPHSLPHEVVLMNRLSSAPTALQAHYEVVVVGSGYGGAIAASRMARAGRSVCVLERGREFVAGEFPRTPFEGAAQVQYNTAAAHIGS